MQVLTIPTLIMKLFLPSWRIKVTSTITEYQILYLLSIVLNSASTCSQVAESAIVGTSESDLGRTTKCDSNLWQLWIWSHLQLELVWPADLGIFLHIGLTLKEYPCALTNLKLPKEANPKWDRTCKYRTTSNERMTTLPGLVLSTEQT